MTTMTKRVIPADIWDALKASAEQHGGIGAGWFTDDPAIRVPSPTGAKPLCLVGHFRATGLLNTDMFRLEAAAVLPPCESFTAVNDNAVREINERKGTGRNARVSWDEYVAEMGWERGE